MELCLPQPFISIHPSISIFKLRPCPCPILCGWQHQAMSGSPCISVCNKPLSKPIMTYIYKTLPCTHNIMYQNGASINPMLAASGWYWPSSGTSWHVPSLLAWLPGEAMTANLLITYPSVLDIHLSSHVETSCDPLTTHDTTMAWMEVWPEWQTI